MNRRLVERPDEEIWELTVPGRVNLMVTDQRGHERLLTARGVGQRLRLTEDDRLLLQERIREAQNDPFQNGMLIRVDSKAPVSDATADQLTHDDLHTLFELDMEAFRDVVSGLGEVPVRRLYTMAAQSGASVLQANFLKDSIDQRWPTTSGETPTWREINASPS